MFPEDEEPEGGDAIGPLLPPEDRVWRHPAEVAAERRAAAAASATELRPRRRLAAAGAAAITVISGGLVVAGIVFALGTVGSPPTETVAGEGSLLPVARTFAAPDTTWSDDLLAQVDGSTPLVTVTTPDGPTMTGSGVVFERGYVLTSLALAERGSIEVTAGRYSRPGLLIGADPLNDLAVLAVDDVFEPAALGLGDGIRLGQYAIVHDPGKGELRLDGRIVSISRSVDFATVRMHGLLEYTSPEGDVIPGAGILDADGRVIGVTSEASQPGTDTGLAIPIDLAVRSAMSLIEFGTPDHPWLGIQGADAEADRLDGLDVDGGVLVLHVFSYGPAAQAGLMAGDIVTDLAGTPVRSMSELVLVIRYASPDTPVSVGFVRDGIARTTEVVLGHRAEAPLDDPARGSDQD